MGDENGKENYHFGMNLSVDFMMPEDGKYNGEDCVFKFSGDDDVWVYTGFTFEELIKMSEKKEIYKEFLSNIDVLVDGKFILKQRDLNLLFRGSKNQRLINVKETLKKHEIITLDEEIYFGETLKETEPIFI